MRLSNIIGKQTGHREIDDINGYTIAHTAIGMMPKDTDINGMTEWLGF